VNFYEDALANFARMPSFLNEDAPAHNAGKPPVYGEILCQFGFKGRWRPRAPSRTSKPYRGSYLIVGYDHKRMGVLNLT
jgi:hypothetical protein